MPDKMIKTEKRHWTNGYIGHGGGKHKTFALRIFNLGIMIVFHTLHDRPKLYVNFYKLI
jgi:hypothetical protein